MPVAAVLAEASRSGRDVPTRTCKPAISAALLRAIVAGIRAPKLAEMALSGLAQHHDDSLEGIFDSKRWSQESQSNGTSVGRYIASLFMVSRFRGSACYRHALNVSANFRVAQ